MQSATAHFSSQIADAYNVYVNPYGMRRLSPTFSPGVYDVLCARGKAAYDHEGNHRFRELVKQHQKSYSACTCKYQKSKIVSHIVNTVRNASPHGGFVKNVDGVWMEVGDRAAKEKVGQTFRDLLHTKYSSSTKAKARARLRRRDKKGSNGKNSQKSESEQEDDDEDMPTAKKEAEEQQQQHKAPRPEAVPSKGTAVNNRSSVSSDEVRSSVSVVSDGSTDGKDDDHGDGDDDDSEEDCVDKNRERPPIRDVVIGTPPQRPSAHKRGWSRQQPEATTTTVSPYHQHCSGGGNSRRPTMMGRGLHASDEITTASVLEALRSSIQTFDGNQQQQQQQQHQAEEEPSMSLRRNTNASGCHTSQNHRHQHHHPMDEESCDVDCEPLPIMDDTPMVKVDFHDSSTTLQSEQSFEDVMDEFCQNMGVAV